MRDHLRALHPSVCDRCESVVPRGAPIVRWHDHWIHPTCAPGGEDE